MKKIKKIVAVVMVALAALTVSALPIARAQTANSLSLTITPPFFMLNVSPGDSWASSIRVVNANSGGLPVTASVSGFEAADDEGHGTFIPLSSVANDPDALANWITLPQPSVNVPQDGEADIPFSISVPQNAAPGGHYAAILIGTGSGNASGTAGSHVGVSSYISALIFITVSGNINEEGNIQEFSVDRAWYQDPNVNFSIRFANTGNVHVRPSGEIQIYNAFGKEQGTIPVNQNGYLGYVLPSSTRLFTASWQGPTSIWDIGQYTAVITLAYGQNGTKSASQSLAFWVLPIDQILEDAAIIIFVIGGFVLFIRRYVRKALEREIGRFGSPMPGKGKEDIMHSHKKEKKSGKRSESDRGSGTIDLRG
jgi:hypothetical protein